MTPAARMQAVVFDHYGPPEVLQCREVPMPEPGPGQVRVRLEVAGVAPIDAKLRAGALQQHFQPTLPKIPGRDGTGVIDRLGDGVGGWSVGDAVCVVADALRAGTYAQYMVCGAQKLVARPAGLTTHQAAALMQSGMSAWIAVVETARLQPGMRVLVHGGSGSVGGLIVQHARHLGAEVTATCRATNRDYVLGLGAHRALAYDQEDFGVLRDQDVVFDLIGGSTHERSYPVLKHGGQIVYLVAAPIVERGDAYGVRVTRAMITDRPEVLRAVGEAAAAGIYRPQVAAVYALRDAAQAHEALEHGRITRGRAVLEIPAPAS